MTMKSITNIFRLFAVTAAFAMIAMPASAQDDDEGPLTQGDDAKYLSISHVKYKPGKRETAMQLISEHFKPAGKAAGTAGPIMAIHYQTGKYDATFVWQLDGGMADLEWYRSADDVKWFAALAEQEGGEEQAQALLDSYVDCIAYGVTEVGHHHVPEAEE